MQVSLASSHAELGEAGSHFLVSQFSQYPEPLAYQHGPCAHS